MSGADHELYTAPTGAGDIALEDAEWEERSLPGARDGLKGETYAPFEPQADTNTALVAAARAGSVECVRSLLRRGATPSCVAADEAWNHRHYACVVELWKAGVIPSEHRRAALADLVGGKDGGYGLEDEICASVNHGSNAAATCEAVQHGDGGCSVGGGANGNSIAGGETEDNSARGRVTGGVRTHNEDTGGGEGGQCGRGRLCGEARVDHRDAVFALIGGGEVDRGEQMRWLLEKDRGAARTRNAEGYTPLLLACQRKDTECAKALLEFGAPLTDLFKDCDSALTLASTGTVDLSLLSLLLSQGPDSLSPHFVRDSMSRLALTGCAAGVRMLIAAGVEVRASDVCVAASRHLETAEILLYQLLGGTASTTQNPESSAAGAAASATADSPTSPPPSLHPGTPSPPTPPMPLLLSSRHDSSGGRCKPFNPRDPAQDQFLIIHVARHMSAQCVKALLATDPDLSIHSPYNDRFNALSAAASNGNVEVMRLLRGAGCPIYDGDPVELQAAYEVTETLLAHAAKSGSVEAVELALSYKEHTSQEVTLAMAAAVVAGRMGCLHRLAQEGPDLAMPFHLSTRRTDGHGCHFSENSIGGRSVFHIAAYKGSAAATKILIQTAQAQEALDPGLLSRLELPDVLDFAALHGKHDVVKELVGHGVEPSPRTRLITAEDIQCTCQDKDKIVQLLKERIAAHDANARVLPESDV